jgi:hypothetical protein
MELCFYFIDEINIKIIKVNKNKFVKKWHVPAATGLLDRGEFVEDTGYIKIK